MSFLVVCPTSAIAEGGMGLFKAGKKSVLLVWPRGGEIKAFRGRCPHADVPLDEACFDGETVLCPVHNWRFDAANGACVTHAAQKALHAYPLRVVGDAIEVDLGPARPARNPAIGSAPPA
ncbi:toluene monooxygenase system ferredoxin subunit [Rhodoblastus acidophilus]|uniref:Rieske (2Fe-2S) protein n=1 Tax=Rhodoblastus acidophilus TaxID=1074 RepID=UPI002224744C|nr:Rieske 2Fe-2S domain-containing protein [Rhodoblastus acidophilus]MCW2284497.1 toluene monooxygenase system ferredoxin subunit [Rhodoblastus acidophilus]MCW2333344.1 toluene monooxygenase system ferredoxin subunit [Rhodoblastus acidophilus]